MFAGAKWFVVRDGDERALGLYLRHYSAGRARAKLSAHVRGNHARFVGPGEQMVLMTSCARALFVWRRQQYRADGRKGVECVIFRNEGAGLSSELIAEACDMAWQRWPDDRLWTFVSPTQIRSSNPGFCFKVAGFTYVGVSASGLHVLERVVETSQPTRVEKLLQPMLL